MRSEHLPFKIFFLHTDDPIRKWKILNEQSNKKKVGLNTKVINGRAMERGSRHGDFLQRFQ